MAKTAAERARDYRDRKRQEQEAEDAAARDARDAAAPTTMRDAVEAAITAARWLTGADAASIAQARTLAHRIDVLEHQDDTNRALSAHRALSQVLNDLGATATKRMQYELRSRRAAPEEGDEDERESGEGAKEPGNVTQLRRPTPRARA
ncbi:hypothetical protein ACFVR6_03710 [Microbacterium sp. NPDC058021]|uniref:terminase small subunit n=1 Tax=Microbacterium sp. NPDC058021 TaxID=3346306 RepID=UPI0036DAF6BD